MIHVRFASQADLRHFNHKAKGNTMSSNKDSIVKPTVLDSGKRQEFSTGSRRDLQEGKGRFDLFQMLALMDIAKVNEDGAVKYSARNWELGQPCSRYLDSALRHLSKFILGFRDEPHLSQCTWNLLCLHETKIRCKIGLLPAELDDIPSQFFKDGKTHELIKKYYEEVGRL